MVGSFFSAVGSLFGDKKEEKKEKKNGKCKGWPTRMMKKVYMYSLEKLEQDGQSCDANDVKYTCRGHRKCVDGKCQGSAYYNELKLKSYTMADYEKLTGNTATTYAEDKNILKKKHTKKVDGQLVSVSKISVKATG